MNPKGITKFGVGPTQALSLRVSVAALVRVLFKHPRDGAWMLALERKATLYDKAQRPVVEVHAQPFGGAIRILDVSALHDQIVAFHFDSERSRSEGDFRLFIHPSNWPLLRALCIEHLTQHNDPIFEMNPERELIEELYDSVKITVLPGQYTSKPIGTVIEDHPTPTENRRAEGHPTVRIYRIFEAIISDPALAGVMLANSESVSDRDLRELALRDAQLGGKGRANAVLALPLSGVIEHYLVLSPEERDHPVQFENHHLDETVSALFEEVSVPKYHRL